jgi:hypothetical protein
MKFIFNFVFFGILFYLIWLYFPDAFTTLVSWAGKTFDFLKNLIQNLIEKINTTTHEPTHEVPKSLMVSSILFINRIWKA